MSLQIDVLTDADLPFGRELSAAAGWNQTHADWSRFLKLAPSGCFLARYDGQLAGTVTTCCFGDVAWIGMMLVAPERRRLGIGRALMQRAIEHLDALGVTSIRLDATQQGAPLYESFGFQAQYRLSRFAGTVDSAFSDRELRQVRDAQPDELNRVQEIDQQIVGCDRRLLLEALWREADTRCLLVESLGDVAGYLLRRPGLRATFIGPCLTTDAELGQLLLRQGLADCRGQSVFVDVPQQNRSAVAVATSAGLQSVREFLRMARGRQFTEQPNGLLASSGPEKG